MGKNNKAPKKLKRARKEAKKARKKNTKKARIDGEILSITVKDVKFAKVHQAQVLIKEYVSLSGRRSWSKYRALTYISFLLNVLYPKFIEVQAGSRPNSSNFIDISVNNDVTFLENKDIFEMINGNDYTKGKSELRKTFEDFIIFRAIKYKYYLGLKLSENENKFIKNLKNIKSTLKQNYNSIYQKFEKKLVSEIYLFVGMKPNASGHQLLSSDKIKQAFAEDIIIKEFFPNLDGILIDNQSKSKKLEVISNFLKDKTINVVKGKTNQHAETKILDFWIEKNYLNNTSITEPIIFGVRRPCAACAAYFKYRGYPGLISDHVGPFWDTGASLLSFKNLLAKTGTESEIKKIVDELMKEPNITCLHPVLGPNNASDSDSDSES